MKNKGTSAPKRKDEYRDTIHDNEFWVEFGKWTLITGFIFVLIGLIFFLG